MDERTQRDVRETVRDAGAIGVPPWLAVVSALAVARPEGVRGAAMWVVTHLDALERDYAAGREAPLAAAVVPAELRASPELGALDRGVQDHWVRGRRVFAELVGARSFMQCVVFAASGVELEARDAAMLEAVAVACMTLDRGAWPMAVTRRVAGRGGGVAAAVVAGAAMMGSPMLAGAAAASCAGFLRAAVEAEGRGVSVAASVDERLARGERVMGFGRPVVGPDERSPVLDAILREHGRGDGRHVTLLRQAEEVFFARKGLRTTAAAWAAAVLSDLGLTPTEVHAVANHWVTACVFAQAAFSAEAFGGG